MINLNFSFCFIRTQLKIYLALISTANEYGLYRIQ